MDFPGIIVDLPDIFLDFPGILLDFFGPSRGFPWFFSEYPLHSSGPHPSFQ